MTKKKPAQKSTPDDKAADEDADDDDNEDETGNPAEDHQTDLGSPDENPESDAAMTRSGRRFRKPRANPKQRPVIKRVKRGTLHVTTRLSDLHRLACARARTHTQDTETTWARLHVSEINRTDCGKLLGSNFVKLAIAHRPAARFRSVSLPSDDTVVEKQVPNRNQVMSKVAKYEARRRTTEQPHVPVYSRGPACSFGSASGRPCQHSRICSCARRAVGSAACIRTPCRACTGHAYFTDGWHLSDQGMRPRHASTVLHAARGHGRGQAVVSRHHQLITNLSL